MTDRAEANLHKIAALVLIAIMISGIMIGQIVASALDVEGVRRILICSAAILIFSCVALGLLLLRAQRRQKELEVQERQNHPQASRSGIR